MRTRRVVSTGLTLAAACACAQGCASDRQAAQSSTLGTDMLRAPKGTTIGPAGFGIDLVDYRGEPPRPATPGPQNRARP